MSCIPSCFHILGDHYLPPQQQKISAQHSTARLSTSKLSKLETAQSVCMLISASYDHAGLNLQPFYYQTNALLQCMLTKAKLTGLSAYNAFKTLFTGKITTTALAQQQLHIKAALATLCGHHLMKLFWAAIGTNFLKKEKKVSGSLILITVLIMLTD